MEHKFVDGSLVTSISLTPELRKEIIKAVHNERKVSAFIRDACIEKLERIKEQKPVVIKPEITKPQSIHTQNPIAVTEIL